MSITFGYTIIYTADVAGLVGFYERAFGLKRRFVAEDNTYGELETGGTVLAFAAHTLGASNLPAGYTPLDPDAKPAGFELGFVTEDVAGVYAQALAAGAAGLVEPKAKPWGQIVGYVRDPAGTLIEICTPVG